MNREAEVIAFYDSVAHKMADLPIYNPELSVAVTPFTDLKQDWLGVVVTPWCMNIIVLPKSASHDNALKVGEKFKLGLPSGQYEFIRSHDTGMGDYACCSVFSPMHDFKQQEVATDTAQAVLEALMEAENFEQSERQQFKEHQQEQQALAQTNSEDTSQGIDAEENNNQANTEVEAVTELDRRAFLTGAFRRHER